MCLSGLLFHYFLATNGDEESRTYGPHTAYPLTYQQTKRMSIFFLSEQNESHELAKSEQTHSHTSNLLSRES